MLETERNSDYSYAAEESEAQMQHGYFDSTDQYPYNIHDYGQAASVIGIRLDFTSERPKCKDTDFYKLYTEWYTDYSQAEEKADNHIVK